MDLRRDRGNQRRADAPMGACLQLSMRLETQEQGRPKMSSGRPMKVAVLGAGQMGVNVIQGLRGRVLNTQCTYSTSAWGRHNVWRASTATSGGMFGEKLSHYVDLVRWWVGDEVEEVYAVAAPNVISYYEVHDNYHCSYRFKN